MNNSYSKILITGSAGFIGSHLFDRLASLGYEVYGLDDLSGGFMHNVSRPDRFVKLDLRDRAAVALYIEQLKPEAIFHLAADATEGRSQFTPFSAIDRNLVATNNLLIPAIKSGALKKFVLVSSMSVYGKQQTPFNEDMIPQPEDIYGIAKASMERAVWVMSEVYGFDYTIIRPHNVYGPRQNLSDPYRNVIGIFINRLMQGKNFYVYGDGSQKRAFSYIDDIIDGMVKAFHSPKCSRQVLNLGADEAYTLNELASAVLEGYFGNAIYADQFKPTYLPDRPQEVRYAFCSHDKARELIGYEAHVDLREGLRRMIEWAKSMGPQEFTYLQELDLVNDSVPETWKKKLI